MGATPRCLSARCWAALAGLAVAAACATPSSQLAAHGGDGGASSGTGGGSGGGAGASGAAGHGAGGSGAPEGGLDVGSDAPSPPDAPPADVAPDVFVDPDGPPELRFLHGLADVPTVRACLVPWQGDAAVASPPAVPSMEVPYGGSIALAPPAGADPGGAFRVVLVAGDAAALGASSCQDFLAAPKAGVRVAALDVLPPLTLTQPRSLLLVATGCLGGVVLADPLAACGMLAVPPKPDAGADAAALPDLSTAGLVLAELSRVAPPADRVGLQVMHASATLGNVDVRLVPEGGQPPVPLAKGLGLGAIAPHPPLAVNVDVGFGIVPEQSAVGVSDSTGDALLAGVSAGLASAGIPFAELAGGKGFVLVLVGPRPSPSDASTGGNSMRLVWMRQPALSAP